LATLAYVFPGQGSQVVGMGRLLATSSPAAAAVFAEADAALGEPLSQLAWDGPSDELDLTVNAQPALLATSIAFLRAVEERRTAAGQPPLRPVFAGGHSMGQYSAFVAAGVLSLGDGLRLVRERGRLMQAAGEGSPGAMAAIIGRAEVMQAAQESFISSTYWTEGVGPAAALATLRKMQRIDVPAQSPDQLDVQVGVVHRGARRVVLPVLVEQFPQHVGHFQMFGELQLPPVERFHFFPHRAADLSLRNRQPFPQNGGPGGRPIAHAKLIPAPRLLVILGKQSRRLFDHSSDLAESNPLLIQQVGRLLCRIFAGGKKVAIAVPFPGANIKRAAGNIPPRGTHLAPQQIPVGLEDVHMAILLYWPR